MLLRPTDWMVDLTNALDVPLDTALEDVGAAAKTLAGGEGSAIGKMAAVSMLRRPDAGPLASRAFVDEPGSPRRLPVRRSAARTSPRWIIRQRLAHIRLGNRKMPRNP